MATHRNSPAAAQGKKTDPRVARRKVSQARGG